MSERITTRDPELQAMVKVYNALVGLPKRERQRDWSFAWDKFVIEFRKRLAQEGAEDERA